jgi:hypothetical protein
MYKSKSLAIDESDYIRALENRKHAIQVLRELVVDPKTSEDDRDMYKRFLADRDPFAPAAPELKYGVIAEFKKRWRYLN